MSAGERERFRYRERSVVCGDANPDRTFCVIRRTPKGAGFLSNFHHVMVHIEAALERGMVPVVDMQNYLTYYNESEPVGGTSNAWEYFFLQPAGVGLDEVYRSKNVVLSSGDYPPTIDIFTADYLTDKGGRLTEYHRLIKTYMRFNEPTRRFLDEAWNSVRRDGEILAVMSRGTDYNNLKLSDHNIQPDASELLERAKRMMAERNIPYCYLKTEERSVFELFRAEFGDALLATESLYYDGMNAKKKIVRYRPKMERAAYRLAQDYLKNVVVASRCDYLISGINNGSVAAIEFNGGRYKAVDIIDLGRYP
jgi:hypothetical protein